MSREAAQSPCSAVGRDAGLVRGRNKTCQRERAFDVPLRRTNITARGDSARALGRFRVLDDGWQQRLIVRRVDTATVAGLQIKGLEGKWMEGGMQVNKVSGRRVSR